MNTKLQDHPYFKQASLMLEILPLVAEEECFALKGGTAINFFMRDMPRLSVDIDLTYLPIEERAVSLNKMTQALQRIKERIQKTFPSLTIHERLIKNSSIITKLYINSPETQVIIEPNLTIRGTVFPGSKKGISEHVKKYFGVSVAMMVVSKADLYGGKICAALDRQHPRDLYDIKMLLDNEGLTDEIRRGFIVHLAGHDETMSQLLDPVHKDISSIYQSHFEGMTLEPITLEELLESRKKLVAVIQSSLTKDEREFLLSLKKGDPQWELMNLSGIDKLPAIQWKLANIRKMKPIHHGTSVERLKIILKL